MTKKEAEQEFKEFWLPYVKLEYEADGQRDVVARSEAWNNFTDRLCKDHLITSRQYETWLHPRYCQ